MSDFYQHKRGDTFDMSGPVAVQVNGVDVTDFTGWQVACQIRRPDGALVATAQAQWLDAVQGLLRVYVQSTSSWALGIVEIDVQLTMPGGELVSTPTQQFDVVREITRRAAGAGGA